MASASSRPTRPCALIEIGHTDEGAATWRDKRSGLLVCDRHRAQYDQRPDLGPYSWEALDA